MCDEQPARLTDGLVTA